MGDGVEAVDWARLKHNYGSAEDIPDLLRRCAGPESEEAADELLNLLFHQGGWICPAAPAALPFLLRLAADPHVTARRTLLELVTLLAAEAGRLTAKVDPAWPRAWRLALPDVLALLDAPEPEIRRAAANITAACATPGADLLPPLLTRWQAEDDLPTRLDLILALGRAAHRAPAGDRYDEARTVLHAQLDAPHLQLRLAALHALAPVTPGLAENHLPQALAAIRDSGVELWRHTGTVGNGAQAVQHWTADLFPGPSPAYVLGLLADHPDDEQRIGALSRAGTLLSSWRSPARALLPLLAERLTDPVPEVRYRAVELLACLGPAATAYADDVAALLDDTATRTTYQGESVADAAVWALARMNDPRCLPALTACVAATRPGFGAGTGYLGTGLAHCPGLPALPEILLRLPDHAQRLLPAIITTDDDRLLRLCATLAVWGPTAHQAVPRLLTLLADDRHWIPAAEALAGIGTAAHEASVPLLARTRSGDAPRLAAWAHWKVGGDPGPLLETAGTETPADLRRLADLGPHAAPFTAALRTAMATPDPWTQVEAAHALWSATGDTETTAPVLTAALRALAAGTYRPVMLPALRYLTRMGRTPAFLKDVPSDDRRLRYFGGWRAFTEDEAIRAAL
ncbi:hypothetical protein IAG44_42620 [Streptomyces roseirectus]|uniref:PBS lyase n=1 Tax=Streptomyces roseirectus TaxID=2768066 RepID=A0A7H0IRM8_9ACTN|nr:hypothetical protein [Streptomyces roseirectus]QNP75444.1 hypothetical protein IAG44_42620 [Streptomyces roseirectus]